MGSDDGVGESIDRDDDTLYLTIPVLALAGNLAVGVKYLPAAMFDHIRVGRQEQIPTYSVHSHRSGVQLVYMIEQ